MEKIGSLYFTQEPYDDFYSVKGSTYPDINGAIGILFEQASSRGHSQETTNGVLTFPFTIRNQFTTALSTLEAAKNMRVKLLNYQRDFYINVNNENSKNTTKAIIFGDENDKAKTYSLAEILNRHKIKFNKLKTDQKINGINFKKDASYVIPTNQKNSTLIKAMFQKGTTFMDSLFYDISAWAFPLAFNINYFELKSNINVGELVTNLELENVNIKKKVYFI